MKTVKGDLIKLALENEFDVIIHGCNNFVNMGAGIAKTIKQHFPEAYRADLDTTKGDKNKLTMDVCTETKLIETTTVNSCYNYLASINIILHYLFESFDTKIKKIYRHKKYYSKVGVL